MENDDGTIARPYGTGLDLEGTEPLHPEELFALSRKFAAFYMRSPEELGETEIRDYLLHLIQVEMVSYGTYGQVVAALKFLYRVTLGRAWEVEWIPFPPPHTQPEA